MMHYLAISNLARAELRRGKLRASFLKWTGRLCSPLKVNNGGWATCGQATCSNMWELWQRVGQGIVTLMVSRLKWTSAKKGKKIMLKWNYR